MFKLTYQKKRPSPAYCLLRGLYAGLLISLCAYSQTSFATQLILAYDLQQISIENIEQKALSQSSPDDRKIDERSTGEKNTEKRETDEQKSNKRKTEEETGSQFNKHIQWLKQKKYSIWHLKDLLDWQAQGKTLPEKLAVIYFKQLNDEFFNHILPILKQQQIKASVNLNHQWISKDDSKNSSSSDTSDKKTGWSDLKQLNNLHWVNHIQPLSASNKNRSFSSKQLLTLRNELFLNQSIIDFHFGTQGHIASYPGNTLNHEIYQLTSSNHYQLIDLREGYLEPVITPQQVWLSRSLSPTLPLDEFKQLLLFKPLIMSNIKTSAISINPNNGIKNGNKNPEQAALVNASTKNLTRVKLSFDTPLSTAPTKTSCQLKAVSRINHKTDKTAAYSTSYTAISFSLQHQTITELKAKDIVLHPGGRHYDFSFTISQTDLDAKKKQTKNLNHLSKRQESIECLISGRYWFSYPISEEL